MRAITIWQPWASLIAIGAKFYETRAYPPPANLVGQRIAIHAAVRRVKEGEISQATLDAAGQAFQRHHPIRGPRYVYDLPHGAVVCTAVLAGAYKLGTPCLCGKARVVEARPDDLFKAPDEIDIDHFGDYRPGRWAWLLTDVQRLDRPVPAKGKQGWWTWDEVPP